jgi:hypothetical protein
LKGGQADPKAEAGPVPGSRCEDEDIVAVLEGGEDIQAVASTDSRFQPMK